MQTVDNGRMVGAISKRTHCTGTCMSQYDVQLQASICLQSIVILFEHRGEGTNLEFGKRCNAYRTLDLFLLRNGDNCPHFAAPSCGRAVADSQNFWRLEVRTLFCRSNRPSSGPCVAVFIPCVCVSACLRVCPVSNSFLITPRIGTKLVSVDR